MLAAVVAVVVATVAAAARFQVGFPSLQRRFNVGVLHVGRRTRR